MINERGIVLLTSEIDERWLQLIHKSGLTKLGIHPAFGNEPDLIKKSKEYVQSERGKEFLKKAKDLGLDYEFEIHAINYLLPRSLFKKHPEYFRMNNKGHRTPDANLCFSNKDALNIIAEKAVEISRILVSTTHKYYIWQDDYEDIFCHCNECKKYSPSDQNMLLMNAIIKKLKEFDSNAKLAYLAYNNTITPPRKVMPENSIFLEFAPIQREFHTSIVDKYSYINKKQVSYLKELIEVFSVKDGQILEYWLDCSIYSNWKKPAVKLPFKQEIIKKDIDFYHGLGFESITTFGVFLDDEYF